MSLGEIIILVCMLAGRRSDAISGPVLAGGRVAMAAEQACRLPARSVAEPADFRCF